MGGGGGSGFSFSSGGMPGMSSMGGGLDVDDDFGSSFPGGFPGAGGGRPRRARAQSSDAEQEATKVTKPLACTLEELYTGCTKKLKIK